ncbi:MAG: DUF349 domain-containing protein, partial [Rubrivivax sp.]|nr:DUF349 domain-containing protein [Rubrivivax sp.]
MLGWIFRKKGTTPASTSGAATKSAAPAAAPPAPAVDWAARLGQARGDDEALLALARSVGAPLQTKQAAVEALDGEAALKLAERDFRNHDRRVHQLAKRRLLAKVAQRETREQAARLIETAAALAAEADVPVNRSIELDRAWQALDAAAIEPAQRDSFAALTAQLATQMRQRADAEQQHKRWQAAAVLALQPLQAACAEAAAGTQDRAALAAAVDAARGVLQAQPAAGAAAPAGGGALPALQRALHTAALLDEHLAVLDQLLAGPAQAAPPQAAPVAAAPIPAGPSQADAGTEVVAEAEAEAETETETEAETAAETDADEAAAAAVDTVAGGVAGVAADDGLIAAAADAGPSPVLPPVDDPQRAWQALAPLPDPQLSALLQARLAGWQQAREQAQQERQSQRREQARERQRTRKGEQGAALADHVTQAEAALDAGQLGDAHRHLTDIDALLQAADASDALQVRIAAAQARLAQLRGWQHWAGGRARDELVLQAEALAAATVGAGERGGERAGEGDAEDIRGAEAEVARLSIRQRADVITTLRERWKEIDHLGGAGGRALWPRFDAALKAAYEPVAAHLAAQRAARENNLATRRQLLQALEAVGGAAPGGSAALAPATQAAQAGAVEQAEQAADLAADLAAVPAAAETPAPADGTPPPATPGDAAAAAPADAHTMAGALARFHVEWRKLGPLEHTVPRNARTALLARMEAAVRRLEAPLQAARGQARDERAALVAHARALASDGPGRGRELMVEVRALQAEWQRHAKALPLARADEQALWTDFKAAIDAAYAAREAAYSARDAEFEAHGAERAALI